MGLDAQYGALVGRALIGSALFAALVAGSPADAACRQALSLALDVSGSVDQYEYLLQLNGLAEALLDEDVQRAFLAVPDAHVRLHVFEWAGLSVKRVLLEWTEIDSTETLASVSQRLASQPSLRTSDAGTGLGAAMLFGAAALARQTDCWQHTLDISSDGPSNTGPRPRDIADHPDLARITINALLVGNVEIIHGMAVAPDMGALERYYRNQVIRGPRAFIEIATTYDDYKEAMIRKLLREIETLAIGGLPETGAADG